MEKFSSPVAGGQTKPGTQRDRTSKALKPPAMAVCHATVRVLVGTLTMKWGHLGGTPKEVSTFGEIMNNTAMTIHV